MRFKDKLRKMSPEDLFEKSLVMSRRASLMSIINLIFCGGFWLFHEYSFRYLLLIISTEFIIVLVTMAIKISIVDRIFEERIEEENENRRKHIEEMEAEVWKKLEEKEDSNHV